MKRNTKEDIIRAAASLMQKKGYFGTGLNEIIKESGAPRGSIYYHFPNGKEQIAEAAVKWTEQFVLSLIKEQLGKYDDALSAIKMFILDSADRFEENEYFTGVPIAALVLETSSQSSRLKECCHHAFEVWSEAFTKKISESGYSEERAEALGPVIHTMIQGALISAMASGSGEPLRHTAETVPAILG